MSFASGVPESIRERAIFFRCDKVHHINHFVLLFVLYAGRYDAMRYVCESRDATPAHGKGDERKKTNKKLDDRNEWIER